MRSTDRVLVLTPREGGARKDQGMTDPELFTGDNKLHAIMDIQSTLWYLKYEHGVLPPALTGRWTSFPRLIAYVNEYYNKRNVDVIEVID